MPSFIRNKLINNKILFLDGTSGSGKASIQRSIPCFKNVEIPIWDSLYENLAIMHEFDQIDESSAIAMIRTFADQRIYETLIGRHVNFRLKDASSIFRNVNAISNLKRINTQDGEIILNDIKENQKILSIGTHNLLCFPNLIFSAFPKESYIIEMIRHPAYIYQFWLEKNWCNRFGKDPRDFSLWLNSNGEALPWFVVGNEKIYKNLHFNDKTMHSLYWISKLREKKLNVLDSSSMERVIIISFENFVTNPYPIFDDLENILSIKKTKKLYRCLKKDRIPRELNNDQINKEKDKVYKMNLSSDSIKMFEELCSNYEKQLNL